MMKKKILIGCGAQAKYVLDILSYHNETVSHIFDPIGKRQGEKIQNINIESITNLFELLTLQPQNNIEAIICISNNKHKEKLYNKFNRHLTWINAIHPMASISKAAVVESGIIINATAVVQPYSRICAGCMVHAGVVIEHDCHIGKFVNLAPKVTLAGGVKIADRCTIYTGTIVAPNVSIGSDTVIGAGSLVLNDIPPGVLAYGNPAKIIKRIL